MIRTMTKYSFILLDGDKELFLQELQELGVVDIVRSSQPVDETSAAILSEIESVKHRIRCIENGSDSGLVAIQDKISSLRKELAGISASVTHNHPEGIKGAQAVAAAIYMARMGKSKEDIQEYIESRYGYDLDRTVDDIVDDEYSLTFVVRGEEVILDAAHHDGRDQEQEHDGVTGDKLHKFLSEVFLLDFHISILLDYSNCVA